MREHAITPEMIEAGKDAYIRSGWCSADSWIRQVYSAMESARLEGEEAARQERMKAREVAR